MPRIYKSVGPQSNKALTPETEIKVSKSKAPKPEEKKKEVTVELPS